MKLFCTAERSKQCHAHGETRDIALQSCKCVSIKHLELELLITFKLSVTMKFWNEQHDSVIIILLVSQCLLHSTNVKGNQWNYISERAH